MAEQDWIHKNIADALGISEAAVNQWLAEYARSGSQGLLSHPHGASTKLTVEQKTLIPDFLWHGPEA